MSGTHQPWKLPGVISTRVGYSRGDVTNATYRNHGTHAEAIEIIFDAKVTSYRTLRHSERKLGGERRGCVHFVRRQHYWAPKELKRRAAK
jgi:hypothetical protein